MTKYHCPCGNIMPDQTDFLPYKAYIREDENTQKPRELLSELLAEYMEARQQGQEVEFLRRFELSQAATEEWAEVVVQQHAKESLSQVLSHLMFSFWNNYDRRIFECEDCGRLLVEVEANRFVSYLPETDTRHVLWSRHNHNPYGYWDE
jgi:hypothetical protein